MFAPNLEKEIKENPDFRRVLFTGQNMQVVAMSILQGEEIGEEVHPATDQILQIVEGEGEVTINTEKRNIKEEELVFVPAGTTHNLINIGDEELKILSIYSPPQHPPGTIHKTKQEAQNSEFGEKGGEVGSITDFDEP